MIDLLIENYEAQFVSTADRETVDACLAAERAALTDTRHLEDKVIGPADFEWDYTVLIEGFMTFVDPFMERTSGAMYLFLHALRELGEVRPEHIKAVILLEYPYFASLINDFFNFHHAFTREETDSRETSKLTQLRYAGQYLSKYPGYVLIRNELGVDQETLHRLHKLFAQTYVTLGIARGQFMKWCHAGFRGVGLHPYFQNAISGLCNYMWLPVVMAADFAGLPESSLKQVKRALGHLTLYAKLHCEHRLLRGELELPEQPPLQGALVTIAFQGYALAGKRLAMEVDLPEGARFPDVHDVVSRAAARAADAYDDAMAAELGREEDRQLEQFLSEIAKCGTLARTASRLCRCFDGGANA